MPLARLLLASIILAALAGCGTPRLRLPSGPSVPMPDYEAAFERATRACRDVRTLTAELALSGRAGRTKLRGRVLAGLAAPSSVRLEGVAPFGPPAFILVSRPATEQTPNGAPSESILLLPRDARVLTDAPPDQILSALAGIEATPDELRALLAGCVAPRAEAVAGRTYGDDWIEFDLQGGGTAYVRTSRPAQIAAGRHRGLAVEYGGNPSGVPGRVRLWSDAVSASNPAVDLTVNLSQVETNTDIDAAAFSVVVPPDALPLSLEELRDAGPLGARDR